MGYASEVAAAPADTCKLRTACCNNVGRNRQAHTQEQAPQITCEGLHRGVPRDTQGHSAAPWAFRAPLSGHLALFAPGSTRTRPGSAHEAHTAATATANTDLGGAHSGGGPGSKAGGSGQHG